MVIQYQSKVTWISKGLYLRNFCLEIMNSVTSKFNRLILCRLICWHFRCWVLGVSGKVWTRHCKEEPESKWRKDRKRKLCCSPNHDWHPCFLPGWVVGLHGLGCQRMYSLLCALSLYRCHLLHKQRHNSWVNYSSSSATQGLLLSLSFTYTHTFRVHHSSQQNPHTDCRQI